VAAMGDVAEAIEADVYHGGMRWSCESKSVLNGFETLRVSVRAQLNAMLGCHQTPAHACVFMLRICSCLYLLVGFKMTMCGRLTIFNMQEQM